MGVAYKRDIDDMRESPALDIMLLLKQRGANLTYSDPHVPAIQLEDIELQAVDLLSGVSTADCTVILTDHSNVDYRAVLEGSKVVIDTRNALRTMNSDKIVRL